MAYVNESGWPAMTKTEQEQGMAAYMAYGEALTKAGVLVGSNRLQPSSTAATVRLANGKSQVLDGPFVESKEQLGGYFLIDVAGSRCSVIVGGPLPGGWSRCRRGACYLEHARVIRRAT